MNSLIRLQAGPGGRYCTVLVWSLVFCGRQVLAAVPSGEVAVQVDRLLIAEAGRATAPAAGPATTGKAERITPVCNDETFLRRVFLDLVGHPAGQDDILAFTLDTDPDKRVRLVNRLLADEEFGQHWGRYWRDVVMFRRTEDRALIAMASFHEFLAKQFNDNKPWSDTARQMITASGDVRENGATGLIAAQSGMPEDVAAEVSRIFLGVQIQCAQCHDHPTDNWKREQFHHFAAFFPRVAVRLNVEDRTLIVNTIDAEFPRRRPNNNNRVIGTLEHFMPDKDNPASKGTLMEPVFFVSNQKLATGAKDSVRRATLVDWITAVENPWFAKAFVNRTWAELVGRGFYEPVDDLGPDRECLAPQSLDYLSKAFADSGYDVKWLFQVILATDAYHRESLSRASAAEALFTANCSQRLRADQLFDSVISALNLAGRLPQPPADAPPNFRRDPRSQFSQVFGYDPSEPREEIGASIPQALMLMNAPFITQGVSAIRRDALGGVLARNKTDQAALTEVYLNTLGRAPSENELTICRDYIHRVGIRNEAFEDILWSLVNSTEFVHRN